MLKITSSLLKIASFTFRVKDSHRVSQPKTVAQIGWDLLGWAYENAPKNLTAHKPESISQDGFDTGYTGIINWYVPKGVDPNEYPLYIDQFIQEEALPVGIQITYKLDQSKMFKTPVWRLNVVKNGTTETEKLPEMNIVNTNASILFGILDLPDEQDGEINAYDLLSRIDQGRTLHGQTPMTRGPSQVKTPGGAMHIDQGMDEERMSRYLNSLEQVAQAAIKMNSPVVEWY